MTVFDQLESLPLAYLLIVAWVVCANIMAKLLSDKLIQSTSGRLRQILSRNLPVKVTSDNISQHLFENQVLETINAQVIFHFVGDFARLMGGAQLVPVPLTVRRAPKAIYPEKYWSGCPPNLNW